MQLEHRKADGKTDKLIHAVAEKLEANRPVVDRAHSGHISWRWTTKGTIEISFKPDL